MYTLGEVAIFCFIATIAGGIIGSSWVGTVMGTRLHNILYLWRKGWKYSREGYQCHYVTAPDEKCERTIDVAVERQQHLDKVEYLNIPDIRVPQLTGKEYEAGSWSKES